ncbi:MAG: tripartite tricarboxylate transporter substrate binding protein [Betaproteobacteria bacterium]
MNTLSRILLVATLLGVGAFSQAQAQSWPSKPVRFVLSQPAGSSPDIVARLLGDRLSRVWGQPVVIDNRPGGQNVIGAQAAAHSPADGYNFYYGTTAALVINSYTLKTMPYDPLKDFIPVGMIGLSPFVIAANPSFPVKTVAELVAKAKAEPGTISMATEGFKTFGGMIGEMLQVTAGVKFLHVPYSGVTPGIQDTIAGRTQITVQAAAAAMRFITAGQLRAIAVSGSGRLPELPDVPTIAATYPGFDYVGWHALVAPTGTPREIVLRVNRDMDQILKDPEIVKRLADLGPITEGAGTPEALGQFLAAEHTRWARLVKDVGIKPE